MLVTGQSLNGLVEILIFPKEQFEHINCSQLCLKRSKDSNTGDKFNRTWRIGGTKTGELTNIENWTGDKQREIEHKTSYKQQTSNGNVYHFDFNWKLLVISVLSLH